MSSRRERCSVGPELVCCQGHCFNAVTQAEKHLFGLSCWCRSGPLCRWRRGGRWFLFVLETSAYGEAVAGSQAGHLVLARCSGLAHEMDAQTRFFWYPIGHTESPHLARLGVWNVSLEFDVFTRTHVYTSLPKTSGRST